MQNSPSIEVRNDSLDLLGDLVDCIVVTPVVGGRPCQRTGVSAGSLGAQFGVPGLAGVQLAWSFQDKY